MADETIVGQDAAQVGVALEQDAVEIEGFAFVPVGAIPQLDQRGQHGKTVVRGKGAQAQAHVPGQGKQVAHCGKAQALPSSVAPGRIIDAGQVNQLLETQIGMVAQDAGDLNVVFGGDFDGHFAYGRIDAGNATAQNCLQILAKRFEPGSHLCIVFQRAIVLVRLILFCNWMSP